jgi:phosphotransferase system IIB component
VAGEIRAASIAPIGGDLTDVIGDALSAAGIRSVALCGSRLLIDLDDPSRLSANELDGLGTRGWVLVPGGVQLIIGPEAEKIAERLRGFGGRH